MRAAFVDGKLAASAHSFLGLVRDLLGQAPNLLKSVRDNYEVSGVRV